MAFSRLTRLSLPIRPRVDKRFFFTAFNMSGSGSNNSKSARSLLSSLLSSSSLSTDSRSSASRAEMNDKSIEQYIQQLGKSSARAALSAIERGWVSGKVPVSDAILREYFKAASALKKLDSIDMSGLLSLVNKQKANVGSGRSSSNRGGHDADTQAQLAAMFSAAAFPAGSSAKDPLFVARMEPSFRSQLWGVLRTTIGLFLILSFAASMMDEKGGGIASRLGGGSVVHEAEKSDKTFDDVVGVDEAKAELQEIVQYLKNPKKFTRLGGRLPKGVLLTGPPGTGKTLLARAIAGESGVPFFFTSGSEFEEMYVGVGAKRVRDLFNAAKAKSPCIIFIDEIDAIGGARNLKDQSAMKMTLNQLLVEMDGFAQNEGIIVIAATNFPDSLDSALVRPGRLDKHVDVSLPDVGGRTAILGLYTSKVPLARDVHIEQLARGTPGFSGADLFNLVNEAALKASFDGQKEITMGALEFAKDKIMMGSERRSAVISPATAKCTAFHEAGHALTAILTDGADPIHKATIMPRGRSLGMVMQLPDGDQTSMSRKQMLARLVVCMGGRVAEEIVFGAENVTSGASSDIQQATRLAKAMVMSYGLSDKVGVIFINEKEKLSDDIQKIVDEEVQALLSDSYSKAKAILELHRKDLNAIANALIEFETLSGGEIMDIINGKKINTAMRSQKPSREMKPLDINPTTVRRSPAEKTASSED